MKKACMKVIAAKKAVNVVAKKQEIRKGQVWKDRDKRASGREVTIVGFEVVEGERLVKLQNRATGRTTRVTSAGLRRRYQFWM